MNWQPQLHLWTGFKTIPMTTSFTETIRGREQIAEVCLPLFSDGVFSPEFFQHIIETNWDFPGGFLARIFLVHRNKLGFSRGGSHQDFPEVFSPQFFRGGFPRIRSPGKFVLQGHSCSRQDCFFSLFHRFFKKQPGDGKSWGMVQTTICHWVFDDFRFMIHTPCSSFFLKKTPKTYL